ncbi:serine hydrolase [Actinotalea sp. K2]|uniref:serine hydrolase n=1 Tax=Actinotalea sp. K2 TaxID=2939438 RepID=UPI0020175A8C|nr:serine hydrolase [Actinotalea sp. K2]MCL3860944.1 serine hydrolase [Actinotalea sp. K2]
MGGRREVVHRAVGHVAVAGLVLAAGALVACTPAPQDAPASTEEPSPPGEDSSPQPVDMPGHAAGRQAAWVIEQLEADSGSPVPEAAERFADLFLEEIPADQLPAVLDQVRALGPWVPTAVTGDASSLEVLLEGPASSLLMQLAVDEDERIIGLFFGEPPPPRDPATSWEGLLDEVDDLPGETSLLVATVAHDGTCVALDGLPAGSAAGEQLPVGSIIKLYVLGAVVDAVGRGDLAWDERLTLTDDLRSLPSGELQDAPTGTTVTVEEAARAMIAISDNTATDLLVDAVGREQVEQALTDLGHADPGANIPLATTRELFQLGWGGGAALREEWRDAGTDARRALLDGLPGGEIDIDLAEIGQVAAWTHDVDWFATADDLCAAHVGLAERAETSHGAVLREILAANPGLGEEAQEWAYVAFKGGSSVGTMAGAWYAEPDGGAATVVVLQTAAVDPRQALPGVTMVGIAEDALRLSR